MSATEKAEGDLQRYFDTPGDSRVVIAPTMRMVWDEDRSSFDLVPVVVFQVWHPTEAGRYRKKPNLSICGDDYPAVLRDMANLFEKGLTFKDADGNDT